MLGVFMVKVSVVIPVYNTEKYLRKALDSIVNQTLKDIEIICVNDGSTDKSLEILEEYKKNDSRIKIVSQTNHGLGYSRNQGLNIANGEYIYFIDSDDTLENNALKELYELCEMKSLDVVLFKLINVDEESGKKYPDNYYDMKFLKDIVGSNVFNYNDLGDRLYDVAVSIPGKLFKSDLISDIRFDESLVFEDNPFFIEVLFKAERVYFYDKYLYYRLRRGNSIVSSFDSSFYDVIPISNRIIEVTKRYGHYEEFKHKVLNKKIEKTYFRFNLVDEVYKADFLTKIKEDFKSFKQEIENDIKLYPINRCIFEKALECDTYKELILSVNLFEANNHINGLTHDIRKIQRNEIARIDIKNFGGESNSLEIIHNSDENSRVSHPKWFTNKDGRGMIIESSSGSLNMKFKVINGGKLKLWLRGIDLRDNENKRIKCLIDFTALKINGETFFDGHNLHWHDDPYLFEKKINDCDIIEINVGWMTYSNMHDYVNELDKFNESNIDDEDSSKISKISSILKF